MKAVEQITPVPNPEGKKIDGRRGQRSCRASSHGPAYLRADEPSDRSAEHGEKRRGGEARPDPDAKLLDIFKARILSGAAGRLDPAEATEGASIDSPSRVRVDLGAGIESNTKLERVRLKRRCLRDDPETAGEEDGA